MGTEYVEKFDAASTIANAISNPIAKAGKSIVDFTVATGVETIATLWNSVTPESWEMNTEDILRRTNTDALSLLQENPGSVHLASSIAGSFVPGGIAMKMLSKARSGSFALGYNADKVGASFLGSKQRALSQEIEAVFREAGPSATSLKTLRRQLFASNITQQVADNFVIELAVVGGLNAHPWMEDYFDDPLKNFALGVGIGGVIGAGVALPMSNAAFRRITGKIESGAAKDILESGVIPVEKGFTNVAQYQMHSKNAQILEKFVADTSRDRVARDMAEQQLIQEKEAATQALLDAAPFLTGKDDKISESFRRQISDLLADPNFVGVDQIKIFNMDKSSKVAPRKAILTENVTPLMKKINEATKGNRNVAQTLDESLLDETGKAQTVFVRLGSKEIFTFEGGRNAALAADMPNIKTLLSSQALGRDIRLANPVRDWGEELTLGTRSSSAARQNAEFLQELVANSEIPADRLGQIILGPTHLPRMNAVVSLLDKLPEADRAAARIRITKEFPTYEIQQARAYVEKTVRPTYWQELDNHIKRGDALSQLSAGASQLINDLWIGSGYAPAPKAVVRRAFDALFRNTTPPKGEEAYVAIAKEIWEKGQAIRDRMAGVADADGFIYLYRGMKKEGVGHSAVESYTNNAQVASSVFGDTKLYKIHTSNVITAFPLSMGDGRKFHEFLVGPPRHTMVPDVPISTMDTATAVVNIPASEAVKQGTITADELLAVYAETTQDFILSMKNTGNFTANEISSRLGVTLDGVMQVLGGGNLKDSTFQWRMYTDAEKISEYLDARNKLFAVTGNTHRNQTAKAFSNLDRKGFRQLHQEQTEALTETSGSIIGISLMDMITPYKAMLAKFSDDLHQVVNSLVGDPRIQSADNALRNLSEGYVVTGVGKLYINEIDKLRTQIVEPLTLPFVGLRNKPTALIEFNSVISQLYSMRGWRDIVHDPITNKWVMVNKNEAGEVVFTTKDNGDFFYIYQPEVAAALNAMREPSKELLRMHNLNRKLRGQGPLNDLGFYVPPINLVNKNYAFVIDNLGVKGTQLLVANNEAELLQQVATWKQANADSTDMRVLLKGNKEADDLVKSYYTGDTYTTYANVAQQHAGTSSLAILPTDTRLLNDMIHGYETSILQGGRAYMDHYMRDVTSWLDQLSYHYQRGVRDQPYRGDNKPVAQDAAWQVKNILLGQDQLNLAPRIRQANNMTEFLINRGAETLDNTIATFKSTEIGTKAYFDKLNGELKAIGIAEPLLQSFELYKTSLIPQTRNVAPAVISAGNGMIATAGLRFLELSHGLVNMMSLPILTWSALMERLPGTPVGAGGQTMKFPLRLMMDGIRHMFSDAGRKLELQWSNQGVIDLALRQYDDVTTHLNRAGMSGNATENAANALSSITNNKNIVGLLSSFSDWTERFTRRFSMHVGYLGAKHAYPGIDDAGASMAAMAFADRTVGNYHAAQRPTMFQGTLGAAVGLYQTYMLTFAQHIYRGLEERNFKQLATLMLAQAGIFGMKGLPGYQVLSEQVIANFNDKHYDLTTGTYRAVGQPTAELLLYGMPSSITGTAFWTRGDISPRIPGSVESLALVNSVRQGYELLTDMFGKVAASTGDGNATQAFLESLSLQSLNRPIARVAEIAAGASVTRQGNTVATADEIYTPIGVGARLLGARPLEEQVTRDVVYANRFYEAKDHENRQRAMERIKRGVRSGNLESETISDVAADYLKNGGTAKGWQSVLNDALLKSGNGARMELLRKLEPDSPLAHMIQDMY